jgi:hypothetical protein
MTAGTATVPWVVWSEDVDGVAKIFASRLVDGTHFDLVNDGKALSRGNRDSTVPDITFAGHTPYVTWHEDVNGVPRMFVGHFENPADPTFVIDSPGIKRSPEGLTLDDVKSPISSNCTANPFNDDGDACQGGASPKAFFLFNDGPAGGRRIFGEQYP